MVIAFYGFLLNLTDILDTLGIHLLLQIHQLSTVLCRAKMMASYRFFSPWKLGIIFAFGLVHGPLPVVFAPSSQSLHFSLI